MIVSSQKYNNKQNHYNKLRRQIMVLPSYKKSRLHMEFIESISDTEPKMIELGKE